MTTELFAKSLSLSEFKGRRKTCSDLEAVNSEKKCLRFLGRLKVEGFAAFYALLVIVNAYPTGGVKWQMKKAI